MKTYPTLEFRTRDTDLLLAWLDDFSPTAIEEFDDGVRAFFSSGSARDAAQSAAAGRFDTTALDVPDDDWARRSQENLRPVTVDRVTLVPSTVFLGQVGPDTIAIVIQPSMGFGTGHHATTRLCLAALQEFGIAGRTVLDVGTGSGVLAIAAARLGAARAVGLDIDEDAIQCASENLSLNAGVSHVEFSVADLASADLPHADVVMANLTGALLVKSAPTLLGALAPGGLAILSGLLADERNDVAAAFAPAPVVWERHEDGWVGLAVKKS